MSVINTNQFATGFASPGVGPEFESTPGAAPGEYAAGFAQPSDNIQYGGYGNSLPIATPVFNGGFGSSPYGSTPSSGSGGFNFSSILNQIGNMLSGLFQELGSALGGSSSQPGNPTTPGNPTAPQNPCQPGGPETYFTNATANSTGDPHLSFDGTTGLGATVSDTWNNMTGHGDLLGSDSFNGGYAVSTQTTTPNPAGVTKNASATVTTDGGATTVTMQNNGSYSVTENGQNVSLAQGQTTSLGNGESVTLNSDGSLTVADANGSGGSISTTLKSVGSGVDVTNSAQDVDLGGYLVRHTDNAAGPYEQNAANGSGAAPPGYYNQPQNNGGSGIGYGQLQYQAYQPATAPQGAGQLSDLQQFDPESTGIDNIEMA
jgi:hypothetical protein